MVSCMKCGEIFPVLQLWCIFEKNTLLGVFDAEIKAEGYSKALKGRKTKIRTRLLNQPIELITKEN